MEARSKPIRKFGRILVFDTGEIILDVSYTASSARQEITRQFIVVYEDELGITHASKKSALYKLYRLPILLIEKYVTTRGNLELAIYYEDGSVETLYNPDAETLYKKLSKFNIAERTLDGLIEYILTY